MLALNGVRCFVNFHNNVLVFFSFFLPNLIILIVRYFNPMVVLESFVIAYFVSLFLFICVWVAIFLPSSSFWPNPLRHFSCCSHSPSLNFPFNFSIKNIKSDCGICFPFSGLTILCSQLPDE